MQGLEGVKVLELGHLAAAAYASKLMADLSARMSSKPKSPAVIAHVSEGRSQAVKQTQSRAVYFYP
jgi:crotonobetainyl-CoA:carnitine CoA-transferase CaiB-like acyl-CoA transferase